MTTDVTCKRCGALLHQRPEKAIGSGEVQMVWADSQDAWVCDVTGDEHEPGEPDRPVQVIVKHGDRETMIRLSLAEAGNFVFGPINDAVDDGEPSWNLQESNPDRHASIARWSEGLWKVTAS